ncbi:MAG: N-acetylmuramoyl-L-alanine amidase [Sulfurospirillum sp.]
MLKKIFFLIFIAFSLLASSAYLDRVYSYDKQMSLANSSTMLKIFHSLQNIYIKSIIQNDRLLKIETLKRLIKCSKILKINEKNYKKELSTLLRHSNKIKKKKEETKSRRVSKTTPKLLSVTTDNKSIKFKFNHYIKDKNIKSFALKSSKFYRKIYDINAVLPINIKIKKPYLLRKLRVAQYNKQTIRVVLETRKSRNYFLSIDKNRVIINFFKKTKQIKKTLPNIKFQQSYFTPANKVIVLDPGHGGKDSGAIGYQRRYEKRAVLQIALKCARELKKRGYRVYLTRNRDYFVSLRNRTKFANRKNADLFISIHANAAPRRSKYLSSKGLETFFLSPDRSNRSKHVAALENRSAMADMDYYTKNTFLSVMNRAKIIQANKMALDTQQAILKSLRKKYNVVDGGVREAPFWVLVGAQMPAILIETGYITNPTEGVRLFNPQYQNLLAKGVANGVDNYFLKN